MKIMQCDLSAGYRGLAGELDAAVARVMRSGWYILGKEVEAFEHEFANRLGFRHAVGVASGTDALEITLRAMNLAPGSRVVTVANTAVATVVAIERAGLRPDFVDIDQETLNMSPDALRQKLSGDPGVRAVIFVHLFGSPANIAEVAAICREFELPLLEDCAQAHGADINGRVTGSWGIAGCFSFYPTKNLGAMGDGGAVVTNDQRLDSQLRALRQYGWHERFVSEIAGINSRLDEIQAAILSVRLKYLDQNNRRRQEIAAQYNRGLQSLPVGLPTVRKGENPVYHQYVIRTGQRQKLIDFLWEREIGTAIHYPVPIHRQPAYLSHNVSLPVTEATSGTIMSLPMYPELSDREIGLVIEGIQNFFNAI